MARDVEVLIAQRTKTRPTDQFLLWFSTIHAPSFASQVRLSRSIPPWL